MNLELFSTESTAGHSGAADSAHHVSIFTGKKLGDGERTYLLHNAEILLENRDFILAKTIFLRLARDFPADREVLKGLGRCMDGAGNFRQAVEYYRLLAEHYPEAGSYILMATVLIKEGKDADAVFNLEKALQDTAITPPDRFSVCKSLGNCHVRLGRFEDARRAYNNAYEVDPNSDVLIVNMGTLEFQSGNLEAAARCFDEAIKLNPANERAHCGKGMVLMECGQAREAQWLFIKSLEISIDNITALHCLVKSCYALGNSDIAVVYLNKYLDKYPTNKDIRYTLAGILYHLNQLIDAEREARRILESDPAYGAAFELLHLIRKKKEGVDNGHGSL